MVIGSSNMHFSPGSGGAGILRFAKGVLVLGEETCGGTGPSLRRVQYRGNFNANVIYLC
jgi:hypothetical protein